MHDFSDKIKVCHLNNLSNVIKETNNSINYFITSVEMNNISKKLEAFTNVDKKIKENHIKYIKNRYK